MPSPAAQALILALLSLATLLWLGVLSAEALARVAVVLPLWALGSTLFVASAGTWVALRRAAGQRRRPG